MHGGGAWPMGVEHGLRMSHAEVSVIGWMCGVGLGGRGRGEELGELLGFEPVGSVVRGVGRGGLGWFGRVERRDDGVWVGHCVARGVGQGAPEGGLVGLCWG